ncbi:MAG TPA: hypothetical protein VFR09_05340 [Alphaproteobacteria bacterium]|nr:hypothetical protein [Alphaproteobacteria bacterium]
MKALSADARTVLDKIYECVVAKDQGRITLADLTMLLQIEPLKLGKALREIYENNLIVTDFSPLHKPNEESRKFFRSVSFWEGLDYDLLHLRLRTKHELNNFIRLTIGKYMPLKAAWNDPLRTFTDVAQAIGRSHVAESVPSQNSARSYMHAQVALANSNMPIFAEHYDTAILLTPKGRKLCTPPSAPSGAKAAL